MVPEQPGAEPEQARELGLLCSFAIRLGWLGTELAHEAVPQPTERGPHHRDGIPRLAQRGASRHVEKHEAIATPRRRITLSEVDAVLEEGLPHIATHQRRRRRFDG